MMNSKHIFCNQRIWRSALGYLLIRSTRSLSRLNLSRFFWFFFKIFQFGVRLLLLYKQCWRNKSISKVQGITWYFSDRVFKSEPLGNRKIQKYIANYCNHIAIYNTMIEKHILGFQKHCNQYWTIRK